MRKTVIPILLSAFILCSCNTSLSPESSSTISTVSETALANSSIVSVQSKSFYDEYLISLINEIPIDNGDWISYVEALKIGDRIYSGSKNKLISFKEDLSDFQVLYEYPSPDFYFGGLMQFNEKTICVRFADESSVYEALDPSVYEYLIINLTNQSVTRYTSEKEDQFYPFRGLGDDYYINLKRIEDELSPSFKRDLYKVNPNGEDQLLMADVGSLLVNKKGIYVINYPEVNNNNYSAVYFFNFETQEMNKVMEIKNLNAFEVSNSYILYSAGPYTNSFLYDIVHKTTVFLNKKLGFEFDVGGSDVKDGHIFIDYIYDQVMAYDIMDVDMIDLSITEADKTNLPGYIDGWKYYIVIPPYSDTEEEVPEKYEYTLWRKNQKEKQFVY